MGSKRVIGEGNGVGEMSSICIFVCANIPRKGMNPHSPSSLYG